MRVSSGSGVSGCIVRVFLVGLLLMTAAACGASQGCSDDYAPADPDSCSYNSELAALQKGHDAQAGQLYVPTDVGRGYVYLLVTPSRSEVGDPLAMFLMNRSDVPAAYSDSYSLVRLDGPSERDLAQDCVFSGDLLELEPEEQSERQAIQRCDGRRLRPGYYAVTKPIVLDPGPDQNATEVESSFQVIEPDSS